MIRLLLLVSVLIAGLIFGTQFADQQGYVLISVANKTVEMSLTTLILCVVAIIAIFFLLEYLLKRILSVSRYTRGWFVGRNLRKARFNTFQGLVTLLEGDWKKSEKLVLKGAKFNDFPLLNYLAAAEAAQGRKDINKRDTYLQLASEQEHSELAVTLTKAKLQINQGDFKQALESLTTIKQDHPRNPVLMGLLKTTYLALGDWLSLKNIIHRLTKAGLIDESEASSLQEQCECGLMAEIAASKGSTGLLEYWNALPRKSRKQVELIHCLVTELVGRKADSEAYIVLREAIKKQPDNRLIELLPSLNLPDYYPAILLLKEQLKRDESNAVAQSALAQLHMRDKNWQEAREHFEQAVAIKPNISDYSYLAKVLDKQNRKQAAADVSRKALTLVSSD